MLVPGSKIGLLRPVSSTFEASVRSSSGLFGQFLRHTCATLLPSKGVRAKFVQELLGHATISIKLDTYSYVLPGMGDAAAGAMDEALG
jgi:site-specific recombinase XerD